MAVFLWYGATQAQDIPASEVPAVVQNAVTKTHTNPKDVEWEKKGAYYTVEYEMGRNDHELWITSSGQIVKHKEEISSTDLPQQIKTKIKADYKGYKIEDVNKLTLGDRVLYKIEIERGRGSDKSEMDLVFDKDANALDKNAWYQMPSIR